MKPVPAPAYELQRDYEKAIEERDRGRLPQSTRDVMDNFIKQKAFKELISWVGTRPESDLPLIREHLKSKGYNL